MNAAKIRERLAKAGKTGAAMKDGYARTGVMHSYLRFSSPEQSSGDSERRQNTDRDVFCARHDLRLSDLRLADRGISAWKGRNATHGELKAFLDAIESGRVKPGDVLGVEEIDRITRQGIDEGMDLLKRILRAGVWIGLTSKNRLYAPGAVKEIGQTMELLFMLKNAEEESTKKSERISAVWEAWRIRAAKGEKAPPPGTLPCWIQWVPDESVPQPDRLSRQIGRFKLVEPKAAAIRQIYKWAADGIGVHTITKRLNSNGVPPIGRLKAWRVCTVGGLLARRAVLGEFEDLHGKTYPKFYPAVIKESLWYRVRAAMSARKIGKKGMGRTAEGAANLFMGIVHNAKDGAPLYLVKKQHNYPYLVSSAALRGDPGTRSLCIPYEHFEDGILGAIDELTPADILGSDEGKDDEVHELDGRIKELESHLRKAEARIEKGEDVDTILNLVVKWELELKEYKSKRETLRARAAFNPTDALDVSRELRRRLRQAGGEERTELRERLQSRIRTLIDAIWVLPYDVDGNTRALLAHIVFRSGRIRLVNLCWVRRGKHAGYAFVTSQTLATQGDDDPLVEKRLSKYRNNPAVRKWIGGHLERIRPTILKFMADSLKVLGEDIIKRRLQAEGPSTR
jgi:hypothetical protein